MQDSCVPVVRMPRFIRRLPQSQYRAGSASVWFLLISFFSAATIGTLPVAAQTPTPVQLFGETIEASPDAGAIDPVRAARSGRVRRATADPAALLQTGDASASAVIPIEFNLFDDRSLRVRHTRSRQTGASTIWTGEVLSETTAAETNTPADSEVTLVVIDGRITGSIRTADGEFYRIRHEQNGVHLIEQVDPDWSLVNDDFLEPPPSLVDPNDDPATGPGSDASPAARAAALEVRAAGVSSELDILVVYTAEARVAAGGPSAIQDRIRLAVAEANQGFSNSGIDVSLRLVHAEETTLSTNQAASNSYLNQVTYDASLRALRDRYGADMVSVWVNGPGARGGTVGISWLMTRPSVSFQTAAYSIVELNFTTGPYYAFGHELGHLLGASHDRANSSGSGAYAYSYGYQQRTGPIAERFVTVMAYNNGCSACAGINHFSNPDISVAGHPTGVPASQADSADVRLTFNSTRSFAEQWRATVVTEPGPSSPGSTPGEPAPQAPTVSSLSPTAGTGTNPVFTATYTDPNGTADLSFLSLLVAGPGQSASAINACFVIANPAGNQFWLRNDGDTQWIGPIAPGQSATLANSQCSVSGSAVSFASSGNTVTLRAGIAFASSFSGPREVLLRADDLSGRSSGWQKLGDWTVPAFATAPAPPSVISVSPNQGSGTGATFSLALNDVNGASEISPVLFLIGSQLAANNACYVYFVPSKQTAYVLNTAATRWFGPIAPGSGSVSNGLCTLLGSGMSASLNSNQLIVNLPLSFSGSFIGSKGIWAAAGDATGLWSTWTSLGTITVR